MRSLFLLMNGCTASINASWNHIPFNFTVTNVIQTQKMTFSNAAITRTSRRKIQKNTDFDWKIKAGLKPPEAECFWLLQKIYIFFKPTRMPQRLYRKQHLNKNAPESTQIRFCTFLSFVNFSLCGWEEWFLLLLNWWNFACWWKYLMFACGILQNFQFSLSPSQIITSTRGPGSNSYLAEWVGFFVTSNMW